MNFIVKLLPLKKLLTRVINDLILIIVDWLTKEVEFLSYKEASDAKKLTYIFFKMLSDPKNF